MESYSLVWNLEKQVQGLAFADVWQEHFFIPQSNLAGLAYLKVLI